MGTTNEPAGNRQAARQAVRDHTAGASATSQHHGFTSSRTTLRVTGASTRTTGNASNQALSHAIAHGHLASRKAGFSLDEIKGMFPGGRRASIDRHALEAKACEIDATIKRLQALSNGLHHAAVCPAPNHFECPTFKRLLRAAGAGKLAPSPRAKAAGRRPTSK